MYLFFDTETTGMIDFKASHEEAHQPHLVQLGAILTDASGRVRGELNLLIKPTGWTVDPDAFDVHGISAEDCDQFGVPLPEALTLFGQLSACATVLVAHNIAFDRKILDIAVHRLSGSMDFSGHRQYCTMRESTRICNIPGPRGPKWPTLQEAHTHFFGHEFDDAHDAMADVRACMRIYFALNPTGKSR